MWSLVVRARVRKWDVHIHCNQHFQSGMFEIFVVVLIWYRVRSGGVCWASWMACRCGLWKGMEQGAREGERASICETVTVDIWGCSCAVGMFAWDMPDSSEPRTPGPRSHFVTMVVKANVIVRTGTRPEGKQTHTPTFLCG